MDYNNISILKGLILIATFVIASRVFVPRSVHFWELWKKTKKPVDLANAASSIMAAFFFYSADFMVLMKGIMGWT